MSHRAARRQWQYHFALQSAFWQQVEQGFQRTGIGGFIHRRGDYQSIGLLQLFGEVLECRTIETSIKQIFRGKVLQIPVINLTSVPFSFSRAYSSKELEREGKRGLPAVVMTRILSLLITNCSCFVNIDNNSVSLSERQENAKYKFCVSFSENKLKKGLYISRIFIYWIVIRC